MKKIIIALLLYVLYQPTFAAAQWAVIDAANVVQTTQTAINTFLIKKRQYEELRYQILEFTRNFQELDSSIAEDLEGKFEELFLVVGEIEGLLLAIEEIDDRIDSLYPELRGEGHITDRDFRSHVSNWLDNSRSLLKGATKISAQIIEHTRRNQAEVGSTLEASRNAVGQLSVSQAGVEMMAQMATSLNDLNTQLAVYHQAEMAEHMRRIQQREERINRLESRTERIVDPVPLARRSWISRSLGGQ